ncbi:hypothetical protein M433DRAFT_268302 [Acidomyces richmondensis BFW]|nr:MAG: hypothetical protein FE78DRAFT_72047 [Acidomyces sp. 'richmondensis']KYG49705.1 hypothetical protein M433DRAFT_268302 [Acidomyces richmondensis BFW]
MRIGKPKSKRVPVRLRHKIEKASASKQRKQRREAKKNPQWRSKLKKDPGIPNLFPYKAKLLAEIEENKRHKEEEAQQRRDVAKAQRQGTAVSRVNNGEVSEDEEAYDDELLDPEVMGSDQDEDMNSQDESNPMAALLASAQARAQAYSKDSGGDGDSDEEGEDDEEFDGFGEVARPSQARPHRALPKQALADPIGAVSALIERMQKTQDGMQRLLDHYSIPPLVTAGSDTTSRFLVEVARKRGRLGRGGVPNLHSAALTVLGDLNEQRLELPAGNDTKECHKKEKGEVQIVSKMAEPFRIEGLWGDGENVSNDDAMAVET